MSNVIEKLDWFKEIPWYEWFYAINEFWECYALERKILQKNFWEGKYFLYKWWKLKPDNNWKYISYRLSNHWKTRKFLAHRLIASAFMWLDLNDIKTYVCHIDDNWLNNCLENLVLWNHKINMWMAVTNGTHACTKEKNKHVLEKMTKINTKFTQKDFKKIINLREEWLSYKKIWDIIWMDYSYISKLFTTWKIYND